MRAVVIEEPGGPEVLDLRDVADPVPGPDEVLITIAAAGVNRADLMQRQGLYPPPPGAPPYPGLECAGRIAVVGGQVTGWRPGDNVCALLAGGGYAEQVAVPAGQVLPWPAVPAQPGASPGGGAASPAAAGALPEAACTVYANVFLHARLQPGETILVHGGASGIGTMAIQLAKAAGAVVACTAGSQQKLDRCRELGADLAICYRDEDFVPAVRDFTGGRGADVILDIMGAAYLARNINALAVGGRLVVIGLQGGAKGDLDLGQMLRKRVSVYAASLRARPVSEKAAIVAAVRENVWPLISSGRVSPVVDRVLPLADAGQAHRILEEGMHIGKIVLVTDAIGPN
ncbi:MAG: NAD(P)H-quinone oxidoreductase [Streptosporangiaceae bacterium]